MSDALVRQSLEIVDSDFKPKGSKKKSKVEAFNLYPDQHRIIGKTYNKSGKAEKIGLSINKKYTVQDAKSTTKSKKQILEENSKKLELIRNYSKVILNNDVTKTIIERAVTRRPTEFKKDKSNKSEETAFTEEDFKSFEEEYLNS